MQRQPHLTERVQVFVTREQLQALQTVARRAQTTVSELLRRHIRELTEDPA